MFPKLRICLSCFCNRLGIVLDEVGQELGAINLVGKHLLATLLEDGAMLGSIHRNQLLYCLIQGFRSARLNSAVALADGRIVRKYTRMNAVAEMVGVFEFAEVAEKNKDVTKAV